MSTTDSADGPEESGSRPPFLARVSSTKIILSATLALLCGPMFTDLALSPKRRAFGYVAGDAFYYLTVARNIARHGVPSFDGVHASNAFHPLWQAVCAAVYFFVEHVGLADYMVTAVVLLEVVLIAGAVSLLALAFAEDGHLSPGFVALPFGVYGLINTPVWSGRCLNDPHANIWSYVEGRLPLMGTLWNSANGMESALVLFCFGVLSLLYIRDTRGLAADTPAFAGAFGVAAAFTSAARLDHVLLVFPLVLAFVLRRRRLAGLAAVSGFFVPLALYLSINRLSIGVAFPISGAAKSTFPFYSSDNLRHISDIWTNEDCWPILGTYWREAQICIPAICAFIYLSLTLRISALPRGASLQIRESGADVDRLLVPVAAGVILLAAYNFLFVPLYDQGFWYFPVSTVFVTLSVLALCRRIRRVPRWSPIVVAVASFLAGIFIFVKYHRSEEFHARFASFYFDEGPRIRARYGGKPFKILEYDDGIVAYASDTPAMSGIMMLDPESFAAKNDRKFMRLAFRRGFDRVASFTYGLGDLATLIEAPDGAAEYARRLAGNDDLAGFHFAFDYIAENKEFAIVRMTRAKKGR